MKYIKSNYPHAEMQFGPVSVALVGGKKRTLPGVTLPRSQYLPHEAGKRNTIALSDPQYQRLVGDAHFNSMLRSGLYEFLDEMPAGSKTTDEVLAEKDTQIADLQAKLDALEGTKPPKDADAPDGKKKE